MAVTATVQLPDNPSPAGVVRFVPLGGNGFTAPFAMYTVRNFAISGDGSGGDHTLSVIMDPKFCSVVAYASMQIDVASANRAIHWQLSSAAVPPQFLNATLTRVDASLSGSQIAHTWMPPAWINPGTAGQAPTLLISVDNVNTEVLNLNMAVLLFNIRARESVLYQHLIAARGGSYQSGDA